MISVVLANYNGSEFLAEALDAILGQDHPDFECVIVDDGSTDGSPSIINAYAGKHPDKIVALIEEENCGQGPAFNKGVAAAKGDLVAFMDSDDLWMPHKLSVVQAMADRAPHAVLYTHNLFRHIDGQPTDRRFRELMVGGDVFGHVKRTGWFPLFVPTAGLTFKKWTLEEVLPIPGAFRTCADGYLTRAAMVHGRIESTDECLGYYRKHSGNQVLGNTAHSHANQRYNILIPALNAYYKRAGIRFRFPTGPKWKQKAEAYAQRVVQVLKA